MSGEKNDGGPAFPSPSCGEWSPEYGMSLRDWFAGHTLPAIIGATSQGQHNPWAGKAEDMPIAKAMAFDAYELADAMLAERLRS